MKLDPFPLQVCNQASGPQSSFGIPKENHEAIWKSTSNSDRQIEIVSRSYEGNWESSGSRCRWPKASIHASFHNLFNSQRSLSKRSIFNLKRDAALNEWRSLVTL